MKRNQALVVCVGAVLAVAFVAAVFGAVAVTEKAPAAKIATTEEAGITPSAAVAVLVPPNSMLVLIHKWAKLTDGQRTLTFGEPYGSATGQTRRVTTQIHLVMLPSPGDQAMGMVPNGSVLDASGTTFRREDGVAAFTGSFTIKKPGPEGATIFTGTMELLDGLGSQPQGWLHGDGAGPMSSWRLEAAITGAGSLLPLTSGPHPFGAPRIVGVLVKPL